jgi:hypothetical protein
MKNLEEKLENKIMSNENIGGKNWWKNLEQWKTQRNNLSNRSTHLWLNSVCHEIYIIRRSNHRKEEKHVLD